MFQVIGRKFGQMMANKRLEKIATFAAKRPAMTLCMSAVTGYVLGDLTYDLVRAWVLADEYKVLAIRLNSIQGGSMYNSYLDDGYRVPYRSLLIGAFLIGFGRYRKLHLPQQLKK